MGVLFLAFAQFTTSYAIANYMVWWMWLVEWWGVRYDVRFEGRCMQESEIRLFRMGFVVAALWNLLGAYYGYLNTAATFYEFFGRELNDPLIFAIYKGAWGTTLVYFFGYLVVAKNPVKHSGIVIVGGIGKVGFAITLLQLYLTGLASKIVFIVVIGDFVFTAFFLYYFYRLYQNKQEII